MRQVLPLLLCLVFTASTLVRLSPGLPASVATAEVEADAHREEGAAPYARNPGGERMGTFVATLETAPYPYRGPYGDTGVDFFDFIDPQSGVRFHTNRYGVRFPEGEHYRDGSVLFHIPPYFKPDRPFAILVFFHALGTDIRRCEGDYDLSGQVDDSGRNVILVMPQLAKNAADSSPGKFFRANAFRAFMDETAGVLAGRLGQEHLEKLRSAPVLLAAFSGGYKAAAYVLDRGGVSGRIEGVILLDALYEDVEKFEKWATRHIAESFLMSLATHGECERNSMELAARLERGGVRVSREWPVRSIARGRVYVVQTHGAHMQVPLAGPPARPLALLLRLPAVREGN